jgi:hypothetical protein
MDTYGPPEKWVWWIVAGYKKEPPVVVPVVAVDESGED